MPGTIDTWSIAADWSITFWALNIQKIVHSIGGRTRRGKVAQWWAVARVGTQIRTRCAVG